MQGHPQPVGLLAALVSEEAWGVLSAGEGSKGPCLYEWAWFQVTDETTVDGSWTRGALIRCSLTDPSKRISYRVFAPARTSVTEVVSVAGSRWRIEEGYEQGKGQAGLDQ
jgi:SRSO17 transposase